MSLVPSELSVLSDSCVLCGEDSDSVTVEDSADGVVVDDGSVDSRDGSVAVDTLFVELTVVVVVPDSILVSALSAGYELIHSMY